MRTRLRTSFLLACLLGASCSEAPDAPQPPAPNLEEALAELEATTNTLQAFHAVYRGTVAEPNAQPQPTELVLAYRAPDRSYLRIGGPGGVFENWCLEGKIYLRSPAGWQRASFPAEPPTALRLLESHFPTPYALPPGTRFDFSPANALSPVPRLATSHHPFGRERLLTWLDTLRQASSAVRFEEQHLVGESPGSKLSFSRSSGFLSDYRSTTPRGAATLRLESFEASADATLFEVPDEARASPVVASVQAQIDRLYSVAYLRQDGYGRVGIRLLGGELDWTAELRSTWRSFLQSLHGEALAESVSVGGDAQAYIDGLPEILSPEPFPAELEATEREVVEAFFARRR